LVVERRSVLGFGGAAEAEEQVGFSGEGRRLLGLSRGVAPSSTSATSAFEASLRLEILEKASFASGAARGDW
jgi:hypothetical protein